VKRKTKIIQVGVGGFGRGWFEVVKESPEWEIEAIVDINKKATEEIVEKFNFPEDKTFTSLKDCLKKVEANAVLNITPPKVHKEITEIAVKNGLDVLVEKPISDNMKDAEKMVEMAEKNGRKLMVSQNYRFSSVVRTLRKEIEKESIGKISYCVVNFQKGPKFTGFRVKMEQPLLIDMAIHHFDLMRYFIGEDPVEVFAESYNPYWSWFSGDACLNVIFKFEDDVYVNYSGSWVSKGKQTTWNGDWEIYGEKGTLILKDDRIYFIKYDKVKEIKKIKMKREGQKHSLYEFYSSIIQDREPETSGKDNLKSISMVFNSLKSIKERKTVKFKK